MAEKSAFLCKTGFEPSFVIPESFFSTIPLNAIVPVNQEARKYIKSFLKTDWSHKSGDEDVETYLNNFIDYMENITLEEMKDIEENISKEEVKEVENRWEILDL